MAGWGGGDFTVIEAYQALNTETGANNGTADSFESLISDEDDNLEFNPEGY